MKKLVNLTLVVALTMGGVILNSCSKKDSPEDEQKENIDQNAGKGITKLPILISKREA